MMKIGDTCVRSKGLKGFNVPKAYEIYLDVDWSLNKDFYTASAKKKHQMFINAHKEPIKQLWEEVHNQEVKQPEKPKAPQKKHNIKVGLIVGVAIAVGAFIFMKK